MPAPLPDGDDVVVPAQLAVEIAQLLGDPGGVETARQVGRAVPGVQGGFEIRAGPAQIGQGEIRLGIAAGAGPGRELPGAGLQQQGLGLPGPPEQHEAVALALGNVRLVVVRRPWRVVAVASPVELGVHGGQRLATAGLVAVAGQGPGVLVVQHHPYRAGRDGAGALEGGLGQCEALAKLAETPGLVAHGGEDPAGQHGVPGVFGEAERLNVIALCQ